MKQTFLERITNELTGEGYVVESRNILKNGQLIEAICIRQEGSPLSPTFYESTFQAMEDRGDSFEDILRFVKSNLCPPDEMNSIVNSIQDKSYVLSHVRYRMVKAGTEDTYRDYPHFMWQDIPVIFCVELTPEATTNVTSGLMKSLDITYEELDDAARANTSKLFENSIRSMQDVLSSFIGMPELDVSSGPVMNVIGSQQKNGAAAILVMQEQLEELAEKYGGVILIPSSVHEWIVIGGGDHDAAALNQMIREVNESEVIPEDQLADHAYMLSENLEILQAVDDAWVKVEPTESVPVNAKAGKASA